MHHSEGCQLLDPYTCCRRAPIGLFTVLPEQIVCLLQVQADQQNGDQQQNGVPHPINGLPNASSSLGRPHSVVMEDAEEAEAATAATEGGGFHHRQRHGSVVMEDAEQAAATTQLDAADGSPRAADGCSSGAAVGAAAADLPAPTADSKRARRGQVRAFLVRQRVVLIVVCSSLVPKGPSRFFGHERICCMVDPWLYYLKSNLSLLELIRRFLAPCRI